LFEAAMTADFSLCESLLKSKMTKKEHHFNMHPLLLMGVLATLSVLLILWPTPLWLILPAGLGGAFIFTLTFKPRLFLGILTVLVFFQYSFFGTSANHYLVVWDELFILIFCFSILLNKIRTSRMTFARSPLDGAIVMFFLACILSMLFNHPPLRVGLEGIRNYFFYALVFFCVMNCRMNPQTIRSTIYVIIGCFLLQLPVLGFEVIQAIIHDASMNPDLFRGTFPGANNLSYASLFPIFLFLGLKDFKLDGIRNKLIFLGLLAILVLGQGRLSILLFLIITLYLFRKNIFTTRISKTFLILILLFGTGMVSYFSLTDKKLLRDYNLWKIFTRSEFEVTSGSARYLYYPLTWNLLTEGSETNVLFGFGPGMYGSLASFKYMPPLTDFLSNAFHQKDRGFDPYVSSEIIPVWGELGFVGLIAFLYLLLKSFFFARACLKKYSHPLIRSLATGLTAGSFLMIAGSFFNPVFEVQVLAYPFWLLAGLLARAVRMENKGELTS
jgi:hypothetical protein